MKITWNTLGKIADRSGLEPEDAVAVDTGSRREILAVPAYRADRFEEVAYKLGVDLPDPDGEIVTDGGVELTYPVTVTGRR